MNQIINKLESWFTQRPLWLQDAARRIVHKGTIDTNDLAELIALCKQEAGIKDPNAPKIQSRSIPKGSLQVPENTITLRLEEISNVKGINALSPRKPLKFSEDPLTIIYGGTGSGKSGYVRILKHACGARKVGELHGNVFDQQDSNKGCTFKMKIGTESKELHWSPQLGIIDDIKTTEIYDTDCARVYLTEENEVAYEPWELSLFTQLTDVCTNVGKTLKDEIDRSVSITPPLLAQFQGVVSASWYSNLNHKIKQEDIDKWCFWDQNLEDRLTELNIRLSEPDPAERAKRLRSTKANVSALKGELKKIRDKITDEKCSGYLTAKEEADLKRKAAEEDAKKVFENAPLEEVGSQSWRLLWEHARTYSETIAYIGITFPNISEEARCVLCHQLLNQEAKDRFQSFEDFVKGELQKQASEAEEQVTMLKKEIEDILSTEHLDLYMDSANIISDKEREEVSVFHQLIFERKDSLLKAKSLANVTTLPDDTLLKKLKEHSENLEKRAQKYDKDAKREKRDQLKKQATELEAKKQLSELKKKIEEEVARLKHIHALEKARRLTNPRDLSIKKSALADVLISPAFIKRFKDELTTLGASCIKVKLTKTRTGYGRVYHKIQLNGCTRNVCTTDVLSDGEFRIVSLAAFLADVESQAHTSPFIFDDPITSVDQDFEEATAERLIKLCQTRQVIVFTHRLSLLTLLEEAAKKQGVGSHVVCVRREGQRIGEPGETLVNEKRPNRALNYILKNRLPQARKALDEFGWSEYEPVAKGICTDIRILIERLVENDLLSDIVQRFRRDVQTKNKIHKLAKINLEDCKLLDDYMSKYSKYKHSQPLETPVPIPDPDKLKNDLEDILNWLGDFKKR